MWIYNNNSYKTPWADNVHGHRRSHHVRLAADATYYDIKRSRVRPRVGEGAMKPSFPGYCEPAAKYCVLPVTLRRVVVVVIIIISYRYLSHAVLITRVPEAKLQCSYTSRRLLSVIISGYYNNNYDIILWRAQRAIIMHRVWHRAAGVSNG